MADVITRIVEIEKQCAEEIEKAERDSKKMIEQYRLSLDKKKEKEFAAIISEGKERLAQAVKEADEQTRAEFVAADRENERFVQDPDLKQEIKEKIISILLSG